MILRHKGVAPQLAKTVFLAPSACVIGDVHVGEGSSLWFNVVVRGDVNYIRIGDRTNIQDGTVIHVTRETHPTMIGSDVSVGHGVTLHGCTVHDKCLIGIGAIVLDGAVIGTSSFARGWFSCRARYANSTAIFGHGQPRSGKKNADRG